MPPISELQQVILGIVASVAAVIFAFTTSYLGEDINYLLYKWFPTKKPLKKTPPKKHPGLWGLFLFSGVLATFSGGFLGLVKLYSPVYDHMSGDFRVVVSDFAVNTGQLQQKDSEDVGNATYERIRDALKKVPVDLIINVWGPDELKNRRIGPIHGTDPTTRATEASRLAELLDADLIVYGSVENQGASLLIKPEFYVRVRNFYEAEEITGQFDLGSPILLNSISDISDRVALSKQLSGRTEALSSIILGLAYYSLRDYSQALIQFQTAENINNWEPDQGQHVLHLLEANAVIRQDKPDLNLAESYFRKSLNIRPDYARAMVGLAHIFYRRALLPIETTNDKTTLDVILLNQADEMLQQALASPNQSPLADVPIKVHFELGQINLMLSYCDKQSGYSTAIKEFQIVIDAYTNGNNPRLKERAAESHARLGLINYNSGRLSEAVKEYQAAIDLLGGYTERQTLYQERITQINQSK